MRGVVFDLDETLLDRRGTLDAYARALHAELDRQGSSSVEYFLEQFHRLDAAGSTPRDRFFALVSSQLLPTQSPRDLGHHFNAHAWRSPRLFPGVAHMLRELRGQGLRLGIITNGGAAPQLDKIVNSGLSDLVDCYLVSARFGARKPDRSIFEYMAAQLGLSPRESWFVGDDPYADIWGSKQCGYSAAWVERFTAWPKELPPCYDAHIDSVLGIQDFVPLSNLRGGP